MKTVSASLGVISLEELTKRADLIVYGMVESIERTVVERDTLMSAGKMSVSIATVYITPNRILKGSAVDRVVVKAVENMEDSPRFQQDQEILLFLTQDTDDSNYSTIGLTQGKFDIVNGMVVRAQISVDLFIEKLLRLIHI